MLQVEDVLPASRGGYVWSRKNCLRIERVELRRLESPWDYFETNFGREELRQVIIVGIFGGAVRYGSTVMEFPGYSYETVTAWHVLRFFHSSGFRAGRPQKLALALTPYRASHGQIWVEGPLGSLTERR